MRDLDRALADITAIRSQIAQGALFCGYGPVTVAATGALAIIAGVMQAFWLPAPMAQVVPYLVLWIATAAVVLLIVGMMGVSVLTHHNPSTGADEMSSQSRPAPEK